LVYSDNKTIIKNILAGLLIIGLLVYTYFHMYLSMWGFTGHDAIANLNGYLVAGLTYAIPLVYGLIIGFLTPLQSHKIITIILTVILGAGYITYSSCLIIFFYDVINGGTIVVLFGVFGTILCFIHFYVIIFLSRKIREYYHKKKKEPSLN